MKLTKFQEYVRDEEIEADFSDIQAKLFMTTLKESFDNEYEEICQDIENSLDMSDIIKNAIACNTYQTSLEIDAQIKLRVNELINTTQEEVEDIRIDNHTDNEPCDIESFKRDRELNQ